MPTITRKNIHPNLKWTQINEQGIKHVTNCQDIVDSADQWKNILVEVAKLKKGDSVGIGAMVCDVRYLGLLYATLELGCRLLVLDKPHYKETIQYVRSRCLAPFDVYILNDDAPEIVKLVGETYANQQMYMSTWFNHASPDSLPAKTFNVDGDTIGMSSPTSGSTGYPKPLHYNHNFLTAAGDRCHQLFNYKEDDKILHLSNLHHGASSALFFFPTIKYCKEHYFEYALNRDRVDTIVDVVVKEKINKIMFPNNLVLEKFIELLPPIDHQLDLYCLQANNKNWLTHVKRANINSITSIYGASEVLGPIFVNVLTPTTGENHNVLNYGKLIDDFYTFKIIGDQVEVSAPHRGTFTLNDKFEIDDHGNNIFCRRADLIRINENTMPLDFFTQATGMYFPNSLGFVIPDTTTNKVYLLIDPSLKDQGPALITKINDHLKIHPNLQIDFVDYVPAINFFNNIKFNYDQCRAHFRNKFNLI